LGGTVKDLGISILTSEQAEELCAVAEEAAEKYILSRVPGRRIDKLNVSAEAYGAKPVSLVIDVNVNLSSLMKGFNVRQLVDEAVKEGFKSAEEYLRVLACHSQR
jgi:hypothetical protein